MPNFYWDDLMDCLLTRSRSVVPVVGSELLDFSVVEPNSQALPFSQKLAAACVPLLEREFAARRLPLTVQADASLEELRNLVRAARAISPPFANTCDFPRLLKQAQENLLATLSPAEMPEPLRLLTEMRPLFPFIVTTTTDELLSRTLGLERGEVRATVPDLCVDLDVGWQPGQTPALFHLFGRIDSGADSALSDEDRLEYLVHLHYKGRPDRLLSHLRGSHLIFLGQRFPDYLTLVFLRLLRAGRFAEEGRAVLEAIADPQMQPQTPLVGFLQQYSARTRIYEDGGAAAFLRELHHRWRAATKTYSGPTINNPETEPADMPRPAIFVSFASENRAEAESLAAALEASHLPVWLDRRQLEGGDRYGSKIERHIRHCRLFVPLLSKKAAQRQRGWFRREWTLAHEMLRDVGPNLTWVIPVIIDDLDAYNSADITAYFTSRGDPPHVLHCYDGQLSPDHLALFENKFRAAERVARHV